MLLTQSLLQDLIIFFFSIGLVIIFYLKWSHQYWRRMNIPFLRPTLPFGNIPNPLKTKENIGVTFLKAYQEIRNRNLKGAGIYLLARPFYIPTDPDTIKNILTKNFSHFVDRGTYYNEKDDPISASLFAFGGEKWKNLRTKLTPTFSSGKMKMMYQTIVDCKNGLEQQMEQEVLKEKPIDIKEILACFTTDVIGSCAFGLDCNTFSDDQSPFRYHSNSILSNSSGKALKRFLGVNFPKIARFFSIRLSTKEAEDFFMETVRNTISYRERNNVSRKDFLQLLIELKSNLTFNEMVAQSVVFFVAGFETSSTTMAFALYELSKHQEIQKKLREEVRRVLTKYDNQITYEAIHEMKYMDQVLNETLRKYPPLPLITRECVQDYQIPDSNIKIEKGVMIGIPIMGLHYDPEYFPDPQNFDPERFTEDKMGERHKYVHIPFGEGPRICIGMRFGLIQSKIGLSALLSKYEFTISKKTQEPLEIKTDSIVLAARGEIWVHAKKN